MTRPKHIPTRCTDCGHVWKRPKYAIRKCPKCNSANIQELEQEGEPTPPGVPEPSPEPDVFDEASVEPEPPVVEEKKPAPVAKPKPQAGMNMSMAIPAKSDYIQAEDLTAQEKMLGEMFMGVGIKQPTALAKIVGRGPTDNPQWMDKILSRHGISYQQRLLVHDLLFPDDAETGKDVAGKEGGESGPRATMHAMMEDMREMWYMDMMQKMMGGGRDQGQAVPPQATPPPQEPLVPLLNEQGLPMIDATTGQVIKVPASLFMIYSTQKHAEQPSTLQQFMQFQTMQLEQQAKFIAAMGGNKGDSAETMRLIAEKLAAESSAKMQELNAQRMAEITTLKAELSAKDRLEQQARQYGAALAEKERMLEEKLREIEKLNDARSGDALSVQTEIQRRSGEAMVKAVEGATSEFREGRKEVRGIVLEQVKQKQIVGNEQGGQAVTTSVQEVSLDQVGKELDQMEGRPPAAPAAQQAPHPPQKPRRETLDLSVLVGSDQS